jgi:two-component system nitrate/nitrite response regulator NarL
LRVVLADDHEVFRVGLRALFEGHSQWTVCGEAKNGQEAVDLAAGLQPELIVLDLSMPVMNGIQAARRIRQLSPATTIIVLSSHSASIAAEEALRAGASAYVTKSDAHADLVRTINALFADVLSRTATRSR